MMLLLTGPLRSSFLLLTLFLPATVRALPGQEGVAPVLRGEVRTTEGPVSEGFVVLHRVSAETSGEIDSVRVARDGSFRLPLPYVPDHAARPEIFFASFLHGGLAYFGPAITEPVQLDSLYLIQVYDTVSVPPGGAVLPVTVRNLFLEKTEGGWNATDLFQIFQPGDRTLYSPDEGVIWSYPLPPSSRNFEMGQADLAPDAVAFRNGRMEIRAPLQPGERFFLIRYEIPRQEFELPLPGQTDRLEILVREPAPPAEFPPLVPVAPVEVEEGNVFRRYVGEEFQDATIRAMVAPEPWNLRAEWLGLILAAILGGAGVFGYRRRRALTAVDLDPEAEAGRTREDLLLAVALLDEEFARQGDPDPETRSRYLARRNDLLAELRTGR